MELAERFLSPIQVPQVSMFSGWCSFTVERKQNFKLLNVLERLDSHPQARKDLPVKALLLRLDNTEGFFWSCCLLDQGRLVVLLCSWLLKERFPSRWMIGADRPLLSVVNGNHKSCCVKARRTKQWTKAWFWVVVAGSISSFHLQVLFLCCSSLI